MNEDLFEEELRESLQRQPAPVDFAAKVLSAAHSQSAKKPRPGIARRMALALAAAIGAMAIIPSVALEYRRREEVRGQQAKHDLLVALAITRSQLQQVRQKVQHMGNAQ